MYEVIIMKSDRTQIEQEWKKIFKTDLPKHIHKAYAIKYLKWQKENNQLELSLQKQIDKLVDKYAKGISTFTPSLSLEIKTGTKLIREFKGRKYEVIKLDNGYQFNDNVYKSLSAKLRPRPQSHGTCIISSEVQPASCRFDGWFQKL